MQMDAGLDTGDMLLVERLAIRPDDTTASLHDRLASLGGRLIVEALEIAACGGQAGLLNFALGAAATRLHVVWFIGGFMFNMLKTAVLMAAITALFMGIGLSLIHI